MRHKRLISASFSACILMLSLALGGGVTAGDDAAQQAKVGGNIMDSDDSLKSRKDNVPSRIEFRGETYHRLTGDELKTAFVGKIVSSNAKHSFAETFFKTGQYRQAGDLVPITGKYKLLNDLICIERNLRTATTTCFAAFQNKNTHYAIIDLPMRDSQLRPRRIFIKPFSE